MKATIRRVEPAPPPVTVTLELTEREAKALRALSGRWTSAADIAEGNRLYNDGLNQDARRLVFMDLYSALNGLGEPFAV